MATIVNPAKRIDLPPKGNRNADPISDEPGAHPIETGIGAAVAGAASGLVAGAVAGPMAAAVGVAFGAVAGGYAGKSIGEVIDPTLDDNWLQYQFRSRPYVLVGDEYEEFKSAYRFGGMAESKYGDAGLDLTNEKLRSEWESSEESAMPWSRAREAVKDGYERSIQIRKERCGGAETPVGGTGKDMGETIEPTTDAAGMGASKAETFELHDDGID